MSSHHPTSEAWSPDLAPRPGIVLAVELRGAAPILEKHRPGCALVLTRYTLLDRTMLDRIAPVCVAMPLIAPGFDATQGLERLRRLRYAGDICVVGPPLPAPGMVLSELRAHAGGREIHLIELPRRPA